jgi:dTDP-4-dehydrorhamnose reductase
MAQTLMQWDLQRVLVTGAAGALGSTFMTSLSAERACIGTSLHSNPLAPDQPACDLTLRAATFELLDRINPTTILHTAAIADVDACERQPALAEKVNTETTRWLIDWCKQSARTGLVLISTDQLYDGPGPHREDFARPGNVYARTKRNAEVVALGYDRSLILRTNFVHLAGRDHKGFAAWLLRALITADPIRLFDDVLFSPLHASHVVRSTIELMSRGAAGLFNLGAGGAGTSKADFGLRIANAIRADLDKITVQSVAFSELAAARPNDMRMDSGKAEAVIGRALPSIDETVAALLADARHRGIIE